MSIPPPHTIAPAAFGVYVGVANSPMTPPLPYHQPVWNTHTAPIHAKDPEILAALHILEQTQNRPEDEDYLRQLGINLIFHNGRQALDLMRRMNVQIEFGDTGDPKAHAVWIKDENKMVVNARYKGNMSSPVLYAIAESIYHEAGHAAWLGDDFSSIQEELDCLALNVLAYRAHAAVDPNYTRSISAGPYKQLFDNGVALYARLFFDPDPYKRRLVNRVIEKYGMLPPQSPDHPIPHLNSSKTLAERILHELHRRNVQAFA